MEPSADGREIALVVADQNAVYPIVIDPIVASLQKKLEAFGAQQTDAQFGFAVAISGDRAVVGAWREDIGPAPDVGSVYTLSRQGGTWSMLRRMSGNAANDSCGWSVAISGSRLVYGCPGANSQSGWAFAANIDAGSLSELKPLVIGAGDQFGYSVAVSGNLVLVGAPFNNSSTGRVHLFASNGSESALIGSVAGDNDAEYNRAFVFTEYAGYLRRDADIGGFLFWLGQVSSAPLSDATKQHAMVCSFTTSAEYQQRFSSVVTHSNAECPP
jgi:hypothetical protein